MRKPSRPSAHAPAPKSWWDVDVECRQAGALGIFTWVIFRVRAERDDAIRYALEDAHLDGMETRGANFLASAVDPETSYG